MTKKAKLFSKFLKNPEGVHWRDIETLLPALGYEQILTKGSHRKIKHPSVEHDLIIPIHGGECKPFYKRSLHILILKHNLSLTHEKAKLPDHGTE